MRFLRGAGPPVAALVLSAFAGQTAQTPRPGAAPAAATSAVLPGQVVDADTGQAIDEASVTLTGRPVPVRGRSAAPASTSLFDLMLARGGTNAEHVIAGGNGRFVFRNLPVATYTVRAKAPGYVGSTSIFRTGGLAQVEIRDGQTSARVSLRLWKQAVITGVVMDEAGEPVIGASVRAYRREVTRLGTLSYAAPEHATTDDRGRYRLSGLEPGAYLVVVPQAQSTSAAAAADALLQGLLLGQMPEGGLGASGGGFEAMSPSAVRVGEWRVSSENVQAPAARAGALRVYRTVFFASAATPADAELLTLQSGQERDGVDFAIQPVATGTISGTVSGPAGPAGGVPIRVILAGGRSAGADPSSLDVATGQTQANGRFTLLAVPPGQYRVIARREAPDDMMADLPEEFASNPMIQFAMNMQRGAAKTPLYGEAAVTVGAGGTSEVAVAATEGVTLSGRLEFQDGEPPAKSDLTRAMVALRPLDAAIGSTRSVRPSADGRFTASGLSPDRYGVTVSFVSGGPWLVQRVTAAGRDATTSPVVVEDRPVADVVVTLTRQTGTVHGTVRREVAAAPDTRSGSTPRLTAVAVPANFQDWTEFALLVERLEFVSVSQDDTFRLGPMLPADYLVVVVDEATLDPSGGPALLRSLAAQATRITVAPGDANRISIGVARGPR